MNATDLAIDKTIYKNFAVNISGGGSISDVPKLINLYEDTPSVNVATTFADIVMAISGELVFWFSFSGSYDFSGQIIQNGVVVDTFARESSGSGYNRHYKLLNVNPCDHIQITGIMTGGENGLTVDILGEIVDNVERYVIPVINA